MHLPVSHYPSLSARLFVLQREHWPPESVGWEWGSVRGRVLSAGLAETICLALDVFLYDLCHVSKWTGPTVPSHSLSCRA